MLRIGITGHIDLTSSSTEPVLRALIAELQPYTDRGARGVTCLADGADQIFARAVLELNGSFEVILPARDYREQAIRPDNVACFDELLRLARTVEYAPFEESGTDAYVAANEELLRRSNRLIAVWDGRDLGITGGTAHVVAEAGRRGVPVTVIWPEGAARR